MSQVAPGQGRTSKLWILCRLPYLLGFQSFAQLLPGIGPAWHNTTLLDTTFATYKCMTGSGQFVSRDNHACDVSVNIFSTVSQYKRMVNLCRSSYTTYKLCQPAVTPAKRRWWQVPQLWRHRGLLRCARATSTAACCKCRLMRSARTCPWGTFRLFGHVQGMAAVCAECKMLSCG